MYTQTKIATLLVLATTLVACNSENVNSNDMDSIATKAVYSMMQVPPATHLLDRKLIKTGEVEFATDSMNRKRVSLLALIKKYKAYTTSDEEFSHSGRVGNTMIVRVAAENFDQFLEDVTSGVEQIDRKEVNSEDVSEEFIDNQARLKTKKELELRYLELLKKAKSVTEMLDIEKEAGTLRAEIESIEGRLKFIESRISMSALTISFYEIISPNTSFGAPFLQAFTNGFNNLIWFFVLLVNLWPFVLAGGGALYAIMRYRNRIKTAISGLSNG